MFVRPFFPSLRYLAPIRPNTGHAGVLAGSRALSAPKLIVIPPENRLESVRKALAANVFNVPVFLALPPNSARFENVPPQGFHGQTLLRFSLVLRCVPRRLQLAVGHRGPLSTAHIHQPATVRPPSTTKGLSGTPSAQCSIANRAKPPVPPDRERACFPPWNPREVQPMTRLTTQSLYWFLPWLPWPRCCA